MGPGTTFKRPQISVTVPIYNEVANIEPLWEKVHEVLDELGHSRELVLVNDGSTDGSTELLDRVAAGDTRILLSKLDKGADVVSGWRKNRLDDEIRRNLPSRVANRLISKPLLSTIFTS